MVSKSTYTEFNTQKLKSSIKIAEFVIKIGLVASGLQLAYAFAYDDILSWIAALFKAAFIEVSVWILTQALLRAHILPSRSKVFIWGLLVLIFLISTRANLQYELKHKQQDVFGFGFGLQDVEFTLADYLDAYLRSALLPAIILGLIYARVLIAKSLYEWRKEEESRERRRARYARYRQKQKQLLDEFKTEGGNNAAPKKPNKR